MHLRMFMVVTQNIETGVQLRYVLLIWFVYVQLAPKAPGYEANVQLVDISPHCFAIAASCNNTPSCTLLYGYYGIARPGATWYPSNRDVL